MKPEPIRHRWRDQAQAPLGDHSAPERLAIGFFRALKPVSRNPRAVSRLLDDLVERAEKGETRRPRVTLVFRMAIAALLLGSFGGALAAVHSGEWARLRDVVREWVGHPAEVAARPARERAPAAVPVSAGASEPITAPAPIAAPELPRPARSHESHLVAPAPTVAAPAASALGAPGSASAPTSASGFDDSLTLETSLVGKALAALQQHRPQEALAAVAAYRQQFSHGRLEYEADLAEVKAQVALGKDAAALSVLDRAIAVRGFGALPRSPDVSLLRAELLARTGDCAGSVSAFSQLLDGDGVRLEAGMQERAVYGRAICLGKLGQRAESRKALRDYLNRFPNGRFVEAAQDALDPLK